MEKCSQEGDQSSFSTCGFLRTHIRRTWSLSCDHSAHSGSRDLPGGFPVLAVGLPENS